MRDLLNNSTVKILLPAKRRGYLADASPFTGTVVDLKGDARKLLAILTVGTVNSSTLALTIQESSDNVTFTTLHAFAAQTAATTIIVDLTPTKRYVRAYATLSDTNTYYIDFGLVSIFYSERNRPSNVA